MWMVFLIIYLWSDKYVFSFLENTLEIIHLLNVCYMQGYSYIDTNGAAIQCMMDKGAQIPGEVINK